MASKQKKEKCSVCDAFFGEKPTSRKKRFVCPNENCKDKICTFCFKTSCKFDTSSGDCICPTCKTPISFLDACQKVGQKTFPGELMERYLKKEMDTQKSLLPEAQRYIEWEKDRERALEHSGEISKDISRLRKIIFDMQRKQRQILKEVEDQEPGKTRKIFKNGKWIVEEINQDKRPVGFKCPTVDCRGYTDLEGFCGMCEKKSCTKCHQIENENHVCKKEDLETIQELKKSTKPCPGCSCPIHRISGCNQMWCPQPGCGVLWDWSTGELIEQVNGRRVALHNPHLIQHQRNTLGDSHIDNPEIDPFEDPRFYNHITHAYFVRKMSGIQFKFEGEYYNFDLTFKAIVRELMVFFSSHHHPYKFQKFCSDEDSKQKLKTLRLDYLKNKITEEEWKAQVKPFVVKQKKNQDIIFFLNEFKDFSKKFLREFSFLIESTHDKETLAEKSLKKIVLFEKEIHSTNEKLYNVTKILSRKKIEIKRVYGGGENTGKWFYYKINL